MSIDDVGKLNAKAGICGFTSSLYAFYDRLGHDYLSVLQEPPRMVKEILTYLEGLQSKSKQTLLDDIEKFTQTFAGYEKFNIADYINRLRSFEFGVPVHWDGSFSIAMPPHAVVDYLVDRLGFTKAREVPLTTVAAEAIIGVRRAENTPYNGLKHYFYVAHGKWYSWGNQYGCLEDTKSFVASPYTGEACKIVF